MADVFLSERNVIILTFDANDMQSNICKSIMRRILQILNKVRIGKTDKEKFYMVIFM